MIQRLAAFLLLLTIILPGARAADARKQPAAVPSPTIQAAPPSAEQRFLDAEACLQRSDTPCAQAVQAGLDPASPYARILEARIAAESGNADATLRLLLPLQAETGLLPQAYASLHATLAQAYAGKENPLQAVRQFVLAEPFLDQPEAIAANQDQLWKLLAGQPRETLVEMRGESPDPVTQGWIDLALARSNAAGPGRAVEQWRKAYPDHPANETALLKEIASASPDVEEVVAVSGMVALLLPLDDPDYAQAARAVQAGFNAAHEAAGYQVEIRVYSTDGSADAALQAYQAAQQDGARLVVGPLLRNEVEAVAAAPVPIPTLALNQPDAGAALPEKLLAFSLSPELEARQVARMTRDAGMQSVLVLVADNVLAERMAKAFAQEWLAQDGSALRELALPAGDDMAELKTAIVAQPADMVFLAADAADARRVRRLLDPSTPAFGTSHVYDGDAGGTQNRALATVRFVDMPWLLNPDDGDYAPYRQGADALGKGWPQRWFALGVDAYRLLPFLGSRAAPGTSLLHGLSGDIGLDAGGRLTRNLVSVQFGPDGAVPAKPLP